ncbi:hypothetical protein [Nocardioides dubius]
MGASLLGVTEEPQRDSAGEEHHALAGDVIAFAIDPLPSQASRLRLAPRVRLGLGAEIVAVRTAAELADAEGWLLEETYFRAYLGPFSALRLLRHQVDDTGSAAISADGAFEVSTDPHPHCASPPVAAPPGYQGHRRVSLQPSRASSSTCLMWFSVDLFLDDQGRIAAVTLDLWEP